MPTHGEIRKAVARPNQNIVVSMNVLSMQL